MPDSKKERVTKMSKLKRLIAEFCTDGVENNYSTIIQGGIPHGKNVWNGRGKRRR
jgi:hypothetical protein